MNSLKISDFKLKSGKYVNINSRNSSDIGLLYDDRTEVHQLINFLERSKNQRKGQFRLNNWELTTVLPKRRPISKIGKFHFYVRFLPLKWLLIWKWLVNPNFLYEARLKHIKDNYAYLYANDALNNKKLKTLYRRLDEAVNRYVNNFYDIFESGSNNYYRSTYNFYEKFWGKVRFVGKSDLLTISLATFSQSRLKLFVLEQKLILLQALFDQVQGLFSVTYGCPCASKDKKDRAALGYRPAIRVFKKYLNLLKVEIMYKRYLIFRERSFIKKYTRNLKKYTDNKIISRAVTKMARGSKASYFDTINLWISTNQDRRQSLINDCNQLIKVNLPNEANIIKQQIIQFSHGYHKMFQEKKITYSYLREAQQMAKRAKTQVRGVVRQSYDEAKKIISVSGLRFNWLTLTRNITLFDHIKVQLINAYMNKSQLLIIDDAFSTLSKKEVYEFTNALHKLREAGWSVIVLNITRSLYMLQFLSSEFYLLTQGNLVHRNLENIDKPNRIKDFKLLFPDFSTNIKPVTLNKKSNIIWGLHEIDIKSFAFAGKNNIAMMAISPIAIRGIKTKHYNELLDLSIKGEVIKVKKKDGQYCIVFETFMGEQILFQSDFKQKWKEIEEIYFMKNALLFYNQEGKFIWGI